MFIFGTNVFLALLGLLIQKSYDVLFYIGVEGHFEVIQS